MADIHGSEKIEVWQNGRNPIQSAQSTICIGKQAHQFLVHFQRRGQQISHAHGSSSALSWCWEGTGVGWFMIRSNWGWFGRLVLDALADRGSAEIIPRKPPCYSGTSLAISLPPVHQCSDFARSQNPVTAKYTNNLLDPLRHKPGFLSCQPRNFQQSGVVSSRVATSKGRSSHSKGEEFPVGAGQISSFLALLLK